MKSLLKNRIFVGLSCIILSLVICFGLTPMFNSALKSKVELVRVNAEIKKGEQITKNMLITVETGGYNLPVNLIYKSEDAIGKYANADLHKGDYILESKLADTPMLKNDYLSRLNGENRAISVTIKSFAAGLSGKLEQGDIVTLIAADAGQMRETVILPELQYVEIIAATLKDGRDHNVQEHNLDDGNTRIASSVTLLVSPEQARLLADLEQTGRLHAALVYRGCVENAQKFLDIQQTVLDSLYPPEPEEAADNETGSMFEQR